MKNTIAIIALSALLCGCNITSGSKIVIGNQRAPVAPSSVRLYVHPPAKFEEIAILSADSRNDFASSQSLTDSTINRLKRDAASVGANGILLSGIGDQSIGMIGSTFGSMTANTSASAGAFRSGNSVNAIGTGTSTAYGSAIATASTRFKKAASGTAIYVWEE